jgi:hypothetical protein
MLDVSKCMKSSPEVLRTIILLHAITEPPTVKKNAEKYTKI